jgi:hypothetical protein
MRKVFLSGALSCLLALTTTHLSAFPSNPGVAGTLDIGFGWRNDSLSYGFKDERNFAHEEMHTQWKELNSVMVAGRGHIKGWDRLYVKVDADYGWILEGENHTHLYRGSPGVLTRTIDAQANMGSVADISGAFGVNLFNWTSGYELVPVIGFSLHQQLLNIHNGVDKLATVPPIRRPFNDLKVTYKSRWYGPYVGLDGAVDLGCSFRLDASGEYHWAAYKGNGVWRVNDSTLVGPDNTFRTTFHSHAHGEGVVARGGLFYKMDCNNWGVGAVITYQRWRTHGDGDYHTTNSTQANYNNLPLNDQKGTIPIIASGKLTPVVWNSYGITVGFHGEW